MEAKVPFSRNLSSSWYSTVPYFESAQQLLFSQPISVSSTFKIILLISASNLQMAVF